MTRADRTCAIAIACVTHLAWPLSMAGAQSAQAEVLFREGRELVKQGKIAAGCDKLAASDRIESSVGTLLNLGDCREELGKLASAWAAFRKAEGMARRAGGDDKRQAEASRRALRLEPRLSYLEIVVRPGGDGLPVGGLIVRRDGEIVDDAQWNTALPIDPGSYTIAAAAPGYQTWRTTVSVRRDAKREVVVVPRLEPMPVARVAESIPAPREPRPATEVRLPAVTTHRTGTWSTTRALSVASALAGAGALGAGIYFGLHANDLEDRADQRCPLTVCADLEGLQLNSEAQTSAARANILYLTGGGTLAAAAVLWFAGAPGATRVIPTAGDRRLGVALTGRF
jgi:hypothetical protein